MPHNFIRHSIKHLIDDGSIKYTLRPGAVSNGHNKLALLQTVPSKGLIAAAMVPVEIGGNTNVVDNTSQLASRIGDQRAYQYDYHSDRISTSESLSETLNSLVR
jgi:hypothetical protein